MFAENGKNGEIGEIVVLPQREHHSERSQVSTRTPGGAPGATNDAQNGSELTKRGNGEKLCTVEFAAETPNGARRPK